ncbi:MAG: hypothetical protein R3A13_10070 [Bdellovibrionota bacterium]
MFDTSRKSRQAAQIPTQLQDPVLEASDLPDVQDLLRELKKNDLGQSPEESHSLNTVMTAVKVIKTIIENEKFDDAKRLANWIINALNKWSENGTGPIIVKKAEKFEAMLKVLTGLDALLGAYEDRDLEPQSKDMFANYITQIEAELPDLIDYDNKIS